jgi:hypothetical protein
LIAFLLLLGLVLWTSVASAAAGELVVLMAPAGSPPELREALQRVRGELTVHGFSIRIVASDGVPSIRELEATADQEGAVASVVLIGSSMPSPGDDRAPAPGLPGASTDDHLGEPAETAPARPPPSPRAPSGDRLGKVEVWISDRVTGKTIKRTITLEDAYDAPTVLAVRTVELLRSSLQEEQPKQTHSVEGAHPERAAHAVTELKRSLDDRPYFYVGLAFAGGLSLPDGAVAAAPSLNAGWALRSLGAQLVTIGPLIGASTNATSGQFDAISVTILAEPFWAPLRKGGHTLFFFPSIGGTYLEVKGVASGDYIGQTDSAWVVTTGAGVGGHLRLGQHFGLTSDLRALFLLPKPVVQIGAEEKELGAPLLTAQIGLRLTL